MLQSICKAGVYVRTLTLLSSMEGQCTDCGKGEGRQNLLQATTLFKYVVLSEQVSRKICGWGLHSRSPCG